ncbi:MAG: phosphate acyltransferase PlsX [Planctomycetes bacterium]|nr:phosphate acyltransferase PlsX [Planctomycetota bacterium]MCB9910454.1 phosphate acyltransferase PlsX [Planctomycetota bacterium]MCB9912580.1 phosphate acyltransferase PlsX [Planctomycetota bacterium]HPF15557.1 phosphate acyltransferase PlsX [Planctomycetota bacterium]
MSTARIGLDVLGGDRAPDAILDGAWMAVTATDGEAIPADRIVLYGDAQHIESSLTARGGNPGFTVVHAPEAIGMDEKPAQALRAKRHSSIVVGTHSVKTGDTGAFVSMGNTGAVVGAATLMLGTLAGVRRPGIAVTLNITGSPLTLLDMGANTVPKPEDLVAYGIMGSLLQRDCLGVPKPRVGLLNIGEEDSKGTEVLQTAHKLLHEAKLDFIGNVEGGDIFQGKSDVVVTDGFTGNVALKLMEGLSGFMLQLMMGELKDHAAGWGPEALKNVKRHIDYSEYGGALLLGVDGVVIIGHGRSDGHAVHNALKLAARALDSEVNASIVRGLESRTAPAAE